ncbi:MAG: hypothetical protein J5I93_21975 [Pirellulaceae bacterium]|nr:hypothetical protein [Pirellulaceae bacterium]
MFWRFFSLGLWALMIVIILLGSLGIVGRNFAGLAFLIATVAEVVSLIRKSSQQQQPVQAAAAPVPLTAEMIRTQDRGYDRACRQFKSGWPVRYEEIELQLVGSEATCRLTLEQQPPAADETAARRELQRAQAQLAALVRLAPDFDSLLRDRQVTFVLCQAVAGRAVPVCTLTNGTLSWVNVPRG